LKGRAELFIQALRLGVGAVTLTKTSLELSMSKVGYQTRIKARIAELRSVINDAQSELHDLEVAERVLERLADSAPAVYNQSASVIDVVPKRSSPTRGGNTVADQAMKVLIANDPMTTVDLLQRLQMTWRADLAQTTLASTLSRMSKDELIVNERGLWRALSSTIASGDDLTGAIDGVDLVSATGSGTANVKSAADDFEQQQQGGEP
jgi:hypothetical protein